MNDFWQTVAWDKQDAFLQRNFFEELRKQRKNGTFMVKACDRQNL